MIGGKTLEEKVSNEKIRFMADMENIEKYVKSQRLRWFGHVERKDQEKAQLRKTGFIKWKKDRKT